MPDGSATDRSKFDLASLKETIVSLVIAFAMAFAFRGFVVEAFVIPTGSMAPTLMGAHMRLTSDLTGADWPVGPWDYFDRETRQHPRPVQGGEVGMPIVVHDPSAGTFAQGPEKRLTNVPLLAGDRIFVLKYLYSIFDPERFDVVVFKNPTDPYENYIKRLIGLPGEQIALIDGDVFARRARDGGDNPWAGEGWQIARKSERVQRAVWYPVFDSRLWPSSSPLRSPWTGAGWSLRDPGAVRREQSGTSRLDWDAQAWPITDFLGYNEDRGRPLGLAATGVSGQIPAYPVSDVRTAMAVFPDGDLDVSATVGTRGHEFRARISGAEAIVEMRGNDDGWIELHRATMGRPLPPGVVTTVDFWHVDQALWLFVDGRLVAGGPEHGAYDWSPQRRVRESLRLGLDELRANQRIQYEGVRYPKPRLWWEFSGSPVTIRRSGVWRDLFYQPSLRGFNDPERGLPALATHPTTSPSLGPDQFFVCGDNSASSLDGRLWSGVDPWVQHTFDHAERGIVPRELLIGKAFFVYFPAVRRRMGLFVPDFGRMRFIW